MSWQTITDAQVAAYQPVTGRLLRKMRNNLRAVCIYHSVTNPLGTVSASTSSTSTVTLFTIRLFVPDYWVGPNGVMLTFGVTLTEEGSTPPNLNGRASLKVGTETSAGGYAAGSTEMAITLTTISGNEVVDVEFRAYVVDAAHTFYVVATQKPWKAERQE